MPIDFLPKREIDLLQWSANFRARIELDPDAIGLTTAQVAAYAAVQQAYATAYTLANRPSTRTSPRIREKNTAKRSLQRLTRQLASIVRTAPNVSVAQRLALGLSLQNPGGYRPPLNPPKIAPGLKVVRVWSHTVYVQLYNQETMRRAMPRGCTRAVIHSYIGAVPPMNISNWRFAANTSTPTHAVRFEAEFEPFTKVWLAARWMNPRAEMGPVSAFVSTHLQPGVVKAA